MKKLVKISEEFKIFRFKNGIKLIKPELKNAAHQGLLYTGHSINSILQLPMSVYLLNPEGETQKINDEGATVCGFDSTNQSIGRSIHFVSKEESADKLIDNCQDVLHANQIKIFEEQQIRKDGVQQQFLSIKSPFYDENDSLLGVLGFSIVLGKHSLADSLSTLTQLGMMNNQQNFSVQAPLTLENLTLGQIHLTQRERECLFYTVKGYTAKKIARILNLSYRTVEEYLTNIRIKTGATSKAELIEKVLEGPL